VFIYVYLAINPAKKLKHEAVTWESNYCFLYAFKNSDLSPGYWLKCTFRAHEKKSAKIYHVYHKTDKLKVGLCAYAA